MIPEPFDVVVVPFPFVDSPATKLRPAVVLSAEAFNQSGSSIMAMITSAQHSRWPGDVVLDHAAAGLTKACIARLKVFTLDNRLIQYSPGRLTDADRSKLARELRSYLLYENTNPQP